MVSETAPSRHWIAIAIVFTAIAAIGIEADVLGQGKGDLRSEYTTRIAVDAEGRPYEGGTIPLEMRDAPDGVLLVIRTMRALEPGNHFLAYPLDLEGPLEIRVVTEKGPNCYWNRQAYKSGGTTIYYFVAANGPFAGFELNHDGPKLTFVRHGSQTSVTSRYHPFVGRRLIHIGPLDGE